MFSHFILIFSCIKNGAKCGSVSPIRFKPFKIKSRVQCTLTKVTECSHISGIFTEVCYFLIKRFALMLHVVTPTCAYAATFFVRTQTFIHKGPWCESDDVSIDFFLCAFLSITFEKIDGNVKIQNNDLNFPKFF